MIYSKKVTLKAEKQEKLKPLLILFYCFGFNLNEFDTFSGNVRGGKSPTNFQGTLKS